MALEIKVPTLGESIVDAVIVKWLKQPGENVARSEPIVELETDKVSIEVSAPQAGVLGPIAHAEGQNVSIGDVLTTLIEATVAPSQAAEPAPQAIPCLLYTSPSPRDRTRSRMPSFA